MKKNNQEGVALFKQATKKRQQFIHPILVAENTTKKTDPNTEEGLYPALEDNTPPKIPVLPPQSIKKSSVQLESCQSTSSFIINRRKQNIAKVKEQMSVIYTKQQKLVEEYEKYRDAGAIKDAQNYKKAANAAKNIYKKIDLLAQQYLKDGNLEVLKSEGLKVLDEKSLNVQQLQEHRRYWKLILANLAALICTAGLAHVGYSIYKREFSLFKPETDSGKKVRELKDSVNSLACN